MSSIIRCPYCHLEFTDETTEEIVNPTLKIVRKSVERSSWKNIAEMIYSGQAYKLFNVGDSILCNLKTREEILIDVAGFDLYGENQVVFCFHTLYGSYVMNKQGTNVGGFAESEMQRMLNNEILNKLPDDLQTVIKPREIKQQIRGVEYSVRCKLWIPSIFEVRGAEYSMHSSDAGDVWFPIFKDDRNIAKQNMSEDGRVRSLWLRSPYIRRHYDFWYITGIDCYCGRCIANYDLGICPCFII